MDFVQVLETERLILRRLTISDAAFFLQLLNEPSWIKYIGDRGVRTLEAAEKYLQEGPISMGERVGFGLNLVVLKPSGEPIGICGLIKREALEDVDIGFAFLPGFWGKGYAFESASATILHGKSVLGLSRIVAITSQDNDPSGKLLEKLGFRFEGLIRLAADGEDLKLFAVAI